MHIVLDDMVRTGGTIVECCRLLRQGNPRRLCFVVTHSLSSAEARENLNSKCIDEILTSNTIPSVLNRDSQGRLRKKMVVLKIEKWISRFLLNYVGKSTLKFQRDFYSVDCRRRLALRARTHHCKSGRSNSANLLPGSSRLTGEVAQKSESLNSR